MDEFYNLLKHTHFPQHRRKNVLNGSDTTYEGFVLGKVKSWTGSMKYGMTGHCIVTSIKTDRPKYQLLFILASELLTKYDPDFPFTTIQFNKNYQMKKHLDGNNVGDSYIIGLGDYTGGELRVWDINSENYIDIDIKNKWYKFNGSIHFHETQAFEGTRITLVYFKLS